MKNFLAVLAGFCVFILFSSVLVRLQIMIYPGSSGTIYRSAGLTGLDTLNLLIRVVYVCLDATIGGMITTLIGRNRTANLVLGATATILIVSDGLLNNLFHPIWFWLMLIVFITPAALLGYRIVKRAGWVML